MNDADHDEFIHLHVVTKNLQSIQAKERFENFLVEFDAFEFDVLLLSENWRADKEEHFTTVGGHKVLLSGGSPGRRGVGICIAKKIVGQNQWCSVPFLFGPSVRTSCQFGYTSIAGFFLLPAGFMGARLGRSTGL